MEKYCNKCNIYKKLDEYHKHKKGKFGCYPICKLCRKREISNNIDDNKVCKCCNKLMDKSNFYKNSSSKSGLASNCKECYLKNRSESQSRLKNYVKIILAKFKKKNKVNFTEMDIIRCYNVQDRRCYISNHKMSHIVDIKGRTDNIFNMTIIPINEKKVLDISDVKLVINLFYSVGKKYNLNSDKILNIYKELI